MDAIQIHISRINEGVTIYDVYIYAGMDMSCQFDELVHGWIILGLLVIVFDDVDDGGCNCCFRYVAW